jgi:hypothetical protein
MGIFYWPVYLVYKSIEQETPILCIVKFQGPSGTQMKLGFFWRNYFSLRTKYEKKKHTSGPLGPKQAQVAHARSQAKTPMLVLPPKLRYCPF